MADVPSPMKMAGRPEDPVFNPAELLFRRVKPEEWDDEEDMIEAVELPDMSVNREKHGGRPEYCRLVSNDYANWGVLGFQVKDIPQPFRCLGILMYRSEVFHSPNRYNYHHSEIRAFENSTETPGQEVHVSEDRYSLMPKECRLLWREALAMKCRRFLSPSDPTPDPPFIEE